MPLTYTPGASDPTGPYTNGGTFDYQQANNMEAGIQAVTNAFNGFQQDIFTPFVYSGLVASKDGTVANQLDVTAGVAFIQQSDSTLARRAPSSTTFTTSVVSSTYYLDLNPDGSWSWGTAHSAQANYLPIASVTTDASGNIASVSDARGVNTTLLSGMEGSITFDKSITAVNFYGALGGGIVSYDNPTYLISGVKPQELAGSARGILFQTWDGTAEHNAFSIGTNGSHGAAYVEDNGTMHSPTFIGAIVGDGQGFYVHDDGGSIILRFANNPINRNLAVQGWVNSGGYYSSIRTLVGNDGSFYTGMCRNGAWQNNRIFTGANQPANPSVGDVWYPH